MRREDFANLIDATCEKCDVQGALVSVGLDMLRKQLQITSLMTAAELNEWLDEQGGEVGGLVHVIRRALRQQSELDQLRSELRDLVHRHWPADHHATRSIDNRSNTDD
jgi:aryl carrier-like protein